MRQVLSVLLLLSVLLSSTGFTLNRHFCGEILAHITLSEQVATCCGEEDEEDMPSDCCHDEFDQLLLEDSQLNHQTLELPPLTFLVRYAVACLFSVRSVAAITSSQWAALPPPPPPDPDVYLRIQSFLL